MHQLVLRVDILFCTYTGNGLNTAYTGCYGTFGNNFKETDLSGSLYVRTTAKLLTKLIVESNYAHILAIFFAKQGGYAAGNGNLVGHAAFFFQRDILAYFLVHDGFDLSNLLVRYLA